MKILIFSDSHGNVDYMVRAVDREKPDRIFHLGDGWQDARQLHEMFPDIPLEQVPGNCDLRYTEPVIKVLDISGHRILLCHGHTFHVKEGLMDVGYAAQEQKADLLLFGHTHVATQEWAGDALLLNPGSIGYWGKPTYAVVRIEGGRMTADLCRLIV